MDEESFTEDEARRFLQELHDKEQKIIEANRGRAGRAEGIKRLLTQLYPDKAHFIYELLQNAEDARATSVSFDLQHDRLIFSHDGQQLFTAENVDAITNIDTTKREDVNQIGKFGIGFKAVYSYTSRPRIYSGPFRFEIRELFCPFPLYSEPDPFPLDPKQTYFIFPFPGEKKTPEACLGETEEGLRALDERALLFLNKIQCISWKVAGGHSGSVARGRSEGSVISITKRSGGRTLPESVWLKFDREFDRTDGGSLRCSVAFSLKSKEGTSGLFENVETLSKFWEIVPVDGQAHIYFPAVKETTGLKFHVHAPFAAPVDRASVTDTDGNRELVEEIGTLVAENLEAIKSAGLLDRSFLAVLPNASDGIPELWKPVFDSVVSAFQQQDLLPTTDDKNVRATHAMRGDRAIRDVVSPDDLRFLSGNGEVLWAVGVLESTRESAFLDALGLSKFSWKELVSAIGANLRLFNSNPKFEAGEQWLKGKDGKWLGRFYALLDKAFEETKYDSNRNWQLKVSSIIRLADGSFTSGAKHAYFSPTMRLPKGLEFPHVDESVFDEKKPKQAESARSFLIKVGVKEVNDEEVVKNLIATFYGADAAIPPDNHFQHIKLFMDWSAQAKNYEVFKEAKLLVNSAGILSKSAVLYLDEPFIRSGLSAVFSFEWQHKRPRQPLWPDYSGKIQAAAFAKFAEQIGVASKIGIERFSLSSSNPEHSRLCHGWGSVRRTDTEVNREFWIPNLDTWLSKPTLQASLLIWETMAAAAPETFTARYRPNASYPYREAPSLLIVWLKTTPWLPNKAGEFKVPADLSRETLHPNFTFDEGYGWLTKVGFGDNVQRATQAYADRVKVLSDIGVPRKLADKLMGLTEDERQQLLRRWESDLERSVEFPEKSVPDIGRRTARAAEVARNATGRTSATREREVRVTKGEVDARTWLRQEYTNEAGVMFCQMQGSAPKIMPFKYPDENGKFYFDACEFLGDLTVELRANYLALSPDCAAEFKHTCSLTDDEKRARLLAIDPNGSPESLYLKLDTPGHGRLRFTQAHLVDLQAAIRALG